MAESLAFAVSGGTPAADSNSYTLFDSTVCFGAHQLRNRNVSRIQFTVNNAAAGTLVAKFSSNGGTNWDTVSSQAVGIPASNTVSGPFDFPVDGYDDFQLIWTNGGSAQTTWRTSGTMIISDRAVAG